MRGKLAARLYPLFLFVFTSFAQSQPVQPVAPASLNEFVEKRLAALSSHPGTPMRLKDVCDVEGDQIAARVFREYGAVFVGSERVKMPPRCIFPAETDVERFQSELETEVISLNGTQIELQKAAAQSLKAAVAEAVAVGKRISALDGPIAGKRVYSDTTRIWNSRFFPALDNWVWKGKITREEANYVATLPMSERIKRVMIWEASGYYFSTNFSISIFNSVAPPGTSQHLSLIAFDVVESSDPAIRQILNKNGWYQTIRSDEPHFTYIGVPENELPRRGLVPLIRGSRTYWVPNVKSN